MDSAMTIELTWAAHDQPTVACGDALVTTCQELLEAAPELKLDDRLPELCRALTHLWRGNKYRLIDKPDEYRDRYRQRLEAEDPHAAWQEGVVRLRDYGICDLSSIQLPRVDGNQLIFFVVDDYLGIPYRVTAASPDHPADEVTYEPLPVLDP